MKEGRHAARPAPGDGLSLGRADGSGYRGRSFVESGQHPAAMKDAVCSPGGTTIVGVAALERGGLRAAVIDAIDAIQKK